MPRGVIGNIEEFKFCETILNFLIESIVLQKSKKFLLAEKANDFHYLYLVLFDYRKMTYTFHQLYLRIHISHSEYFFIAFTAADKPAKPAPVCEFYL